MILHDLSLRTTWQRVFGLKPLPTERNNNSMSSSTQLQSTTTTAAGTTAESNNVVGNRKRKAPDHSSCGVSTVPIAVDAGLKTHIAQLIRLDTEALSVISDAKRLQRLWFIETVTSKFRCCLDNLDTVDRHALHAAAANKIRQRDQFALERREICKKLESANPLPDRAVLEHMDVSQLKELAVRRGIKGGRSWPDACPPAATKSDILTELVRLPGHCRPKTVGKGWLPPEVQKLEDKCMAWLKALMAWSEGGPGRRRCDFRIGRSDSNSPYNKSMRDSFDCCEPNVHLYMNEDALTYHDDNERGASCTICQRDDIDPCHEYHCAGCNECTYGRMKLTCERCTPALYVCACFEE